MFLKTITICACSFKDVTITTFKSNNGSYMTMGFGIYEQSLLLLTNASEDFIAKSKARELFLHYKIYKVL